MTAMETCFSVQFRPSPTQPISTEIASVTPEGREPEPPFTMQQVYDILITRVAVTDVVDEKLGKYTQYEYTVEYKIHKNNGTFRTDLGHDDSRKQYFILSDSTGSEVLIDQILGYQYKN